MAEIVVAAEPRTESGKNASRRLRASERIPAVLYGGKGETRPVAVSPRDVLKVLRSAAGDNTLFDVELDGKRRKVILKEYQVQPISGDLLHVDLFEVALDKILEVKVRVELLGTPIGVKNEGGVLDFITRDIEVECLPGDIPEKIAVDVAHLGMGNHLRVSELEMPKGVTCVTEPGVVVAHVVAPRTVVEEEAAEPAEGEEPAADAVAADDKEKDVKKEKDSKKKEE